MAQATYDTGDDIVFDDHGVESEKKRENSCGFAFMLFILEAVGTLMSLIGLIQLIEESSCPQDTQRRCKSGGRFLKII